MKRASALAACALAVAGCSDITSPVVFDEPWQGTLNAGATLEIKGINGRIVASRASGTTASVSFAKVGFDDDPNSVRIEVVTHGSDVTICAVYPTPPGEPENECAPGLGGRMSVEDNDVSVDFAIELPDGVDLVVLNVNGDIDVEGVHGDAFLTTVNGDVTLSTSGQGTATTVNGSIVADIGRTDFDRDLTFTSVNGDVTVTLASSVNARVTCTTVNGMLTSEFMMMMDPDAKIMTNTLGGGGRQILMTTVNGDVRVLRGS